MANDDVDEVAMNVLLADDVSPIVAVVGSEGRRRRSTTSTTGALIFAAVFLAILLWLAF